MQLLADENGVITFAPVETWGCFLVKDELVGLAFDYYASAADAAARRTSRIQLHLGPEGAANLAKSLASHAQHLKDKGVAG